MWSYFPASAGLQQSSFEGHTISTDGAGCLLDATDMSNRSLFLVYAVMLLSQFLGGVSSLGLKSTRLVQCGGLAPALFSTIGSGNDASPHRLGDKALGTVDILREATLAHLGEAARSKAAKVKDALIAWTHFHPELSAGRNLNTLIPILK